MNKYVLSLSFFLSISAAYAETREVTINSTIPYSDKDLIQDKILNECTDLGKEFSVAIKKNLTEKAITVNQVESLDTSTGIVVDAKIAGAVSAGSAFVGHRKSVISKVSLFKNGKIIATNKFSRESMGGVFGGFKGSCSVLYRTVDTLGADIAKWVNEQAQLFD